MIEPHPVMWGRVFLPHHLPDPSPAFHWRMADLIFGVDPYVAIAAPRGFSKSTLSSLVCMLYGAAKEKFRFALLISDTMSQAEMFLEEIRTECEGNEELIAAYPGLRPGATWSKGDLVFSNGVRIQAVGAGMKVRGRKHRGQRPDLVLGDDLENDEAVCSLERRLKFRRWLRAAVLPALSPDGRVRIIGTILHTDSLLSRLLRNPRWTRRLWSAISDDGCSLWPERFPVVKLLAEKDEAKEDGLLATWYHERQNKAIADEESPFRAEDFTYYDDLPEPESDQVQHWTKTLYVDPAISKAESADFTAYSVVYASHDGFWYVAEAFRRKDDPAQMIETIRNLHRKHRFDSIGIESNQYQKSISFWLSHLGDEASTFQDLVEPVISDQDKRRRIMALQPFFRAHRILFSRSIGSRLETELLNLDSIDHEDLADSLAGHLFITIRPEPPTKRKKRFENVRDERAWRHKQELRRLSRLKRHGILEY